MMNYIEVFNKVTIEDITSWIEEHKNIGDAPDDNLAAKAPDLANTNTIKDFKSKIDMAGLFARLSNRNPFLVIYSIGLIIGFQIGYEYRDKNTPEVKDKEVVAIN